MNFIKNIGLIIIIVLVGILETVAQNVGVGNIDPKSTLDIEGDLALRSVTDTILVGVDYAFDVNSIKSSNYKLVGFNANFALGGITAGVEGRQITLRNSTSFSMEIYNEHLPADDEKRISTGINNTLAIYPGGSVNLVYDSTVQRWVVMAAHNYNLNFYGIENHWNLQQDSILYSDRKYVSINSDLNIQPQQANLQVKGGILAQSDFTYTTSLPSESQIYTMNNSPFQFPNSQDSILLILDPGGNNDYSNNMQGNMQLLSSLGFEIKFDQTSFGIGLGDTLWISKYSYPNCKNEYFYRFINTNIPPNSFTLTTVNEYTYFIFRSNGDGNNGKGFEITARKLYDSPLMLQNVSPIGRSFYFDPKKSALRSGLLNTSNIGLYSVGMGNKPIASGESAISMGEQSNAIGNRSIALGAFCNASGVQSVSLGAFNTSSGETSVSMGYASKALGGTSTAMGFATEASGAVSTAFGLETIASGNNTVAIGLYASTGGYNRSFVFNGSSNAHPNNYTTNTASNQMMMNFNEYVFWTNTPGKQVKFWADGGISTTGGICAQGAIVGSQANCFSDIRMKKNIKTLTSSLDKIMEIRPVNFNWLDSNLTKNIQTGVIAQELQKIFPELVDEMNTGMLSVNYTGLIPHIIKAFHEQQSQIIDLKNENAKLKSDFQSQIDTLKKLIKSCMSTTSK